MLKIEAAIAKTMREAREKFLGAKKRVTSKEHENCAVRHKNHNFTFLLWLNTSWNGCS